jgi:hypothetical protein
MREGLFGSDAPRRVEGETLVQQIDERSEKLALVVLHLSRRRRHEPRAKVARRLRYMYLAHHVLEQMG